MGGARGPQVQGKASETVSPCVVSPCVVSQCVVGSQRRQLAPDREAVLQTALEAGREMRVGDE